MTQLGVAPPVEQKHHARAIVRNVAVSGSTHVVSTFAILAVTPFFVAKLGLAGYGLWSLLAGIVRYGFLADFGLGPTITKYTAEYVARGERRRVAELMTFGALFPLAVGCIVVAAISLLGGLILAPFKIPTDMRAIAPQLLTALLAYLFLFMASNVFAALLKGLGRLDVSATTAAIGQGVFALGGVIMLAAGFGIRGLLYASFIQVFVTAIMNYAYLQTTYGNVFCNPFRMAYRDLGALFKMSGWIQLTLLLTMIGTDSDSIVVGLFVGISAVAVLDIGSKLARALLAMAWHFNNAFLPAVAAMEVASGTDGATGASIVGGRYIGIVSLAATGLLIGASPLILHLWFGKTPIDTNQVALVIAILSVTYVITNVVNVGATALRAMGKPRLETTYTAVATVAKVVVTLALAPKFGLPGVLVGTLVATLGGSVYFFSAFRENGMGAFPASLRRWAPKLTLAVIIAAGLVAAVLAIPALHPLRSRPIIFVELAAASLFYVAALVITLRALRFFDDGDLALVERVVPARLRPLVETKSVRWLLASRS